LDEAQVIAAVAHEADKKKELEAKAAAERKKVADALEARKREYEKLKGEFA
jgi:hypothetical protein